MKTKVIILGSLLLVATVGYFYSNSERSNINDLLLMNVEALADDESDPLVQCVDVGSITCPFSNEKVKYVIESNSLEVPY